MELLLLPSVVAVVAKSFAWRPTLLDLSLALQTPALAVVLHETALVEVADVPARRLARRRGRLRVAAATAKAAERE